MESFRAISAFAAVGVLAEVQLITPSFEIASLCPKLDGKSVADSVRGGAMYSVSCDWIMEAEGTAVKVGGKTSPLICIEACEESENCYSVNIAADGGCGLISGKEKRMKTSDGSINLFRLPQRTTATPPVQITATRSATTSSINSAAIVLTPSMSTPTSSPTGCDLRSTNLCPACDDTIAVASGKAYRIFCDSSLFTNGTYSIQEYLSPGSCLEECDALDWCMGVSYYDDRSCEIAKGPDVFPVGEAGYTAFLPVDTSVPTSVSGSPSPSIFETGPRTSSKSSTASKTTSSIVPGSTVSILPINNGCNTSSLTCPACDGITVDDTLDQTFTALCTFAPVCDSTVIMPGPVTQDECMLGCDKDATCLAVLWYTNLNSCHLCQQGLDGGPGTATDFVLLVADIDGGEDDPTSTAVSTPTFGNSSSLAMQPSTYSVHGTGSTPYSGRSAGSTASSPQLTAYQSPSPTTGPDFTTTRPSTSSSGGTYTNTTRSAFVPEISAAACPGLGEGVFVDPTDFSFFKVMCDTIVTAAHSSFTTASDFAACVALCSADCDGVQFGYTSRCGMYQDMRFVGPGVGWTVAASLAYSRNTDLPFSTVASTTMATVATGSKSTSLVGPSAYMS